MVFIEIILLVYNGTLMKRKSNEVNVVVIEAVVALVVENDHKSAKMDRNLYVKIEEQESRRKKEFASINRNHS